MSEKTPAGDLFSLKPMRRYRGVRRVAVHTALLFLAGILLLSAGLFGRQELGHKAQELEKSVRAEALLSSAITETQHTALRVAGSAFERAISNGLSSKKRALKATLAARIVNGEDDSLIIRASVHTLMDGVAANLDDPSLSTSVRAAAEADMDEIVRRVALEVAMAVQSLTPGSARVTLPVTTEHYALMYYHAVLSGAGAVCLALAAALALTLLRQEKSLALRVAAILEPVDYLLPFFLGVAVFTLYPIVRVVIMSFQERYRLEGSFTGWGVGNYTYVIKGLEGTSNYFLQGLSNTLLYVLYTVPASTLLAIVIAWMLNRKSRLSALFQTAYFAPMVTSVTAVGLVWRWIFNRNFGVLNAVLSFFGAAPVDWLQKASHSMTVLVIFGIWSTLPFTIILLLSGLQNIDEAFYTVARVDGAKAFRVFRRITVPLLSPTIGLVLIINSIFAFKVFTEVKVLFNGNPGPVLNMYTVVYYIYDMMYEKRELGRAAAAAIILFLFIFAFTMIQRFIQRRWQYS